MPFGDKISVILRQIEDFRDIDRRAKINATRIDTIITSFFIGIHIRFVHRQRIGWVTTYHMSFQFLSMTKDGRQIFVMGHPEYDRMTLDSEYKRDMGKGLNPQIPLNYYPDDDPENKPVLTWRSHANNLYTNWLNYYVYQVTPYDLYGTPSFWTMKMP